MENDIMFHSMNALRNMEVIDIESGTKLGFIKDFVVDISENRVLSIVLPGLGKGWFAKDEDIEITWDKVVKTGVDVILVEGIEYNKEHQKNNL